MAERARQLATENLPWRRGIGWQVIGVEGLILLGIGLFILLAPDIARDVIRQLIAAILLVLSVLQVYTAFRTQLQPVTLYNTLRGGIGATVGVIVLLEPLSAYLEPQAARFMLALGWLAYGMIGLISMAVLRSEQGLRTGAVLTSGIALVLSVSLFTSDGESTGGLALLGWIAVAGGVALLGYAAYLNRQLAPTSPSVAPTAESQ